LPNTPYQHLHRFGVLSLVCTLVTGCAPSTDLAAPAPSLLTAAAQTSGGAFQSHEYQNLFEEYLGRSAVEVQTRITAAWDQLFYGSDDFERVYFPVGQDMAYVEDIGNGDVRSEGMSYGMMIAVQLDKKEEFDRLWKWARTYMYQADGPFQGYFAWHCTRGGQQLDAHPAPDGEEWFATALLFASARWSDGKGIFDYHRQAQDILDVMLHKEERNGVPAKNMFDLERKQVVFVPIAGRVSSFTNPSYHLPAYYELWARWAERDNHFWAEAARTSREYFRNAADSQTGLMPDYANFDGTPYGTDSHRDFRFDAWRTLSNVAVDYAWFAADPWQMEQSNRVLRFLASHGIDTFPNQFALDGTPLSSDHSTGLVSSAAVAALAADRATGEPFVQALWNAPIPSGQWRYYDGMLYLLGMLHVSGNFKIYTPAG